MVLNNRQNPERYEFSAFAEQQLSYLFLEDFQGRYRSLMDSLSVYIARYAKYSGNFMNEEEKLQKEITLATIKSNLSPVVYMLEALNSDLNDSTVKEHINALKELHDNIVHVDEISLEDLKKINSHISFVVSKLFLRPLMQRLPTKQNRMYGSVDFE